MTTENYIEKATAADGVYLARLGDLETAQRDRWEKLYLTGKGKEIYRAAVADYESGPQDKASDSKLKKSVLRAVRAGY